MGREGEGFRRRVETGALGELVSSLGARCVKKRMVSQTSIPHWRVTELSEAIE